MRLIGVIDLKSGAAVHARAGQREHYGPVSRSASGVSFDGSPAALARWYLEECGLSDLYVADLDAIAGDRFDAGTFESMVALGAPVWVDAGTTSVERAQTLVALGAARVVVGLETLESYDALRHISAAIGERTAFSLDLREGTPLGSPTDGPGCSAEPEAHVTRALDAGVSAVIVLDVARVGMNTGVDVDLIGRLRAGTDCALIAGGGIRDATQLAALAAAGCDGALLATALLDGRLTARDVKALRESGCDRSPSGRSSPPLP